MAPVIASLTNNHALRILIHNHGRNAKVAIPKRQNAIKLESTPLRLPLTKPKENAQINETIKR